MTIYLLSDPSMTFSTISAALGVAGAGETLVVGPGTYTENITITQANLTIQGPFFGVPGDDMARGSGEAVIAGIVRVRADDVTLDGLRLVTHQPSSGGNDRLIDARGTGADPTESFTAKNLIMDVGVNRIGEKMFAIQAHDGLTVEDSMITVDPNGANPGTISRASIRVSQANDVTITGNTVEGYIYVQSGDGSSTTTGITITDNSVDNITSGAGIIVTGPGGAPLPATIDTGANTLDLTGNSFVDPAGLLVVPSGQSSDLSTLNSDGDDTIAAFDGDDRLVGGAGDDRLIGGTGNDTFAFEDGSGTDVIADFDMGDDDGDGRTNDQVDVSGLTDAGGAPVNIDDVNVTANADGDAVLTFPNGETVTLRGVEPEQVNDRGELYSIGIPCFTPDVRLCTQRGEVPAGAIRVGDMLQTRDHGWQPVLWIGRRALDAHAFNRAPHLRPILIPAGAIGNRRRMMVSPQHLFVVSPFMRRVNPAWVGRCFIRAKHLVWQGGGIRQARGIHSISYIHVLMARHEVIYAEGVCTESFHPGKQALAALGPDAWRGLFAVRPDLKGNPAPPTSRALPLVSYREAHQRSGKQKTLRVRFV